MADLPSGSTIGGERIIHKGIAKNHRHHASQINGLNPLFYGDVGDGGGIDADVLSGKTYNDLSMEFLQTSNDSIPSLYLNSHPTSGTHAASLLYLKDSIPENLKSGNFYAITCIGNANETSYPYSVGTYTITFPEIPVIMNGWKYTTEALSLDIRTVTQDFQNQTFYFYVEADGEGAFISAQTIKDFNTYDKIFIGHAKTSISGIIDEYIPISNEQKFGIGDRMLSIDPMPYSIPVSKDTGKVDSGWVFGSKGETIVNLNGPNIIYPRETREYLITNYNSFSVYDVELDIESSSYGALIDSIEDDVIRIKSTDIAPENMDIILTVTRDGGTNVFSITVLQDVPLSLSGPTEVQSGGFNYQFIIEQYIEEYTYTIEVSHGTATRTGNSITYISPSNIGEDIQASLTVSREGSSDTIDFTIVAVPPYELEGRGEVWPNDTFTYNINPYDNTVVYGITTDDPNVTASEANGIITIQTPSGTTNEYTFTLHSNSSIGNVSREITVLGDPEPIDLEFDGVFGVNIFQAIGSPEPALNYTVNVSGTINGVGNYSFGTNNTYALWTGNFRNGSTLTLNLNNLTIHGKGGRGGGYTQTDGLLSGVSSHGEPGGDALLLTTPTHLTVDGCTIRAGGGGGGGACRIRVNVDTSGKVGDSSTIESSGGGGGGSSWGDTIAERGQTIGNITQTAGTSGQNGSGGSGGYALSEESYEGTVHGTFVHYGGDGGGVGSSGLAANGSGPNGFDEEFSYTEGTNTRIDFRGSLGVGGAAGVAIRANGNMLSYNRTNSIIIGNITGI